jgi:hypothetical protein
MLGGSSSSSSLSALAAEAQGSKLTFSFELTSAELDPALASSSSTDSSAAAAAAGGSGGGTAAAAKEPQGYGGLLKQGLGESFSGGPYLTPAGVLICSMLRYDIVMSHLRHTSVMMCVHAHLPLCC